MRPKLRISLPISGLLMLLLCIATPSASAASLKFAAGSYTLDLSASTPSNLSPATGTSLAYPADSLKLSWSPVAGATTYQVQVARQSSTSASCTASTAFQADNIVVTPTVSTNAWNPTLADDATGERIWTGAYCWRVRAAGTTAGSWSAASKFLRTWDSTPTGLKFFDDAGGAIPRTGSESDATSGSSSTKNTGYLSWTAIPGAASYNVQVGTSQSFSPSSIIATREGIRDSRVLMLHLPDDTYYWRVRAIAPNGTEGGWSSGSNSFTVQWYDATWSDPSKLYPASGATVSEVRIGWTPMAGASYYEYQIGTSAGCFWEPTNPDAAPDAYGSWTDYAPIFVPNSDPPVLQSTADPQPSQCRLSAVGATTMNNWVTLPDAFDSSVLANIAKDCLDDEGVVECQPAGIPDVTPDDWGATFHGTGESTGSTLTAATSDDGQFGEGYEIWWHARPVYHLQPDIETGWDVNEDVVIYGSWSDASSFGLDPTTASYQAVGTRCSGGTTPNTNPLTNQCLMHVGSTMQADEAAAVADASTMQIPLLVWEPFHTTTGGYIIQIARDPLFNNIARTIYQPGVKSTGYGFQHSYAMTTGLPDNSEGTGYWWRVTPCLSTSPAPGAALTNCVPNYAQTSAGLPLSAGGSYSDAGVAQTFVKRTTMQTELVDHFEGASPLIRWTIDGVSSADYAAWARGVEGAHYYELELARDPFFNSSPLTLKTTIPRIVPFQPGSSAGSTTELADGIWYYHVRAIDRNGLEGSWSDTASFNKRIEGPAENVTGGGAVPGAGAAVAWDPVVGASDYTFQYTRDESFEDEPTEATTRQTSYHIPNAVPGTYYWRVRANVNGVSGQWSDGGSVVVAAATKLTYALSKTVTNAKEKFVVYGLLSVAGKATNGKNVMLQRKSVGCDGTGTYTKVASALSGNKADDGVVSFTQTATMNGCYRFAYVDNGTAYYSAPIKMTVKPVTKAVIADTTIRRGSSYCARITTNTPITGRLRMQYKSGGVWTTSRSVSVTNMTVRRQCASITRAGKYPTRIVLDNMRSTVGGTSWQKFATTVVTGATVRVNDVFTIDRG